MPERTRYADRTTVSIAQSRAEIEETLTRFGATAFMSGQQGRHALLTFEADGRRVLFRLTMPDPSDARFTTTPTGKPRAYEAARKAHDDECRRLWRTLSLAIKSKLSSVEDGVENFEGAFLAHIVLPDGLTVGQRLAPRIAEEYDTGEMPPLLPGPGDG